VNEYGQPIYGDVFGLAKKEEEEKAFEVRVFCPALVTSFSVSQERPGQK
jgi:hypothetical protein